MSGDLDIIRTVADLRTRVRYWRDQGLRVAMVPTMGALHQGHLSLVAKSLENADRVVASVFVNPTQFGPNEDFSRYPRQEERDAELLNQAGCHVLFAPTVAEMYPDGFATAITVAGVSEGLCGDVRPGHFSGVATVVTKLLLQCLPDVAVFGEKDYQQLAVIRRFVRDLDIPVAVLGAPTLREDDGLAMSSRNAYMSTDERAVAPWLIRALTGVADGLRAGAKASDLCPKAVDGLIKAGFASVDYMEVRDAETLAPAELLDRPVRILVAARLGKTRLIDNIGVAPL
ncbi:pantoate--beta-alanine ligase [Paramagnetospirillum kuznetsovii]|uniref:Pantothenate synthetase n=1 Tax=Paramagnetospirillum kuznetsovii TaxID=2053833 RepID=A0A364P3G6_9PROT|nr:pantoate--beta-alanine ligase [Paramagnetospirillum kuznetsovii]RAU23873.1 pantoate--beta-alanine ligase [Paramagnetospirillum kuznetsovii]